MLDRALAGACLLLLATTPASAKTSILCKAAGRADVVITLQDRRAFNRSLDCIRGEFIADMTPCAPDGGYGLSAPTGSAALVGLAMRWQDYGGHHGAVVGHSTSAESIHFDGGFMGSEGMKLEWGFDVNRLTGAGTLQEEGKPKVDYTCSRAAPKF